MVKLLEAKQKMSTAPAPRPPPEGTPVGTNLPADAVGLRSIIAHVRHLTLDDVHAALAPFLLCHPVAYLVRFEDLRDARYDRQGTKEK